MKSDYDSTLSNENLAKTISPSDYNQKYNLSSDKHSKDNEQKRQIINDESITQSNYNSNQNVSILN